MELMEHVSIPSLLQKSENTVLKGRLYTTLNLLKQNYTWSCLKGQEVINILNFEYWVSVNRKMPLGPS